MSAVTGKDRRILSKNLSGNSELDVIAINNDMSDKDLKN